MKKDEDLFINVLSGITTVCFMFALVFFIWKIIAGVVHAGQSTWVPQIAICYKHPTGITMTDTTYWRDMETRVKNADSF